MIGPGVIVSVHTTHTHSHCTRTLENLFDDPSRSFQQERSCLLLTLRVPGTLCRRMGRVRRRSRSDSGSLDAEEAATALVSERRGYDTFPHDDNNDVFVDAHAEARKRTGFLSSRRGMATVTIVVAACVCVAVGLSVGLTQRKSSGGDPSPYAYNPAVAATVEAFRASSTPDGDVRLDAALRRINLPDTSITMFSNDLGVARQKSSRRSARDADNTSPEFLLKGAAATLNTTEGLVTLNGTLELSAGFGMPPVVVHCTVTVDATDPAHVSVDAHLTFEGLEEMRTWARGVINRTAGAVGEVVAHMQSALDSAIARDVIYVPKFAELSKQRWISLVDAAARRATDGVQAGAASVDEALGRALAQASTRGVVLAGIISTSNPIASALSRLANARVRVPFLQGESESDAPLFATVSLGGAGQSLAMASVGGDVLLGLAADRLHVRALDVSYGDRSLRAANGSMDVAVSGTVAVRLGAADEEPAELRLAGHVTGALVEFSGSLVSPVDVRFGASVARIVKLYMTARVPLGEGDVAVSLSGAVGSTDGQFVGGFSFALPLDRCGSFNVSAHVGSLASLVDMVSGEVGALANIGGGLGKGAEAMLQRVRTVAASSNIDVSATVHPLCGAADLYGRISASTGGNGTFSREARWAFRVEEALDLVEGAGQRLVDAIGALAGSLRLRLPSGIELSVADGLWALIRSLHMPAIPSLGDHSRLSSLGSSAVLSVERILALLKAQAERLFGESFPGVVVSTPSGISAKLSDVVAALEAVAGAIDRAIADLFASGGLLRLPSALVATNTVAHAWHMAGLFDLVDIASLLDGLGAIPMYSALI
eukprot:Opistho-1_new@19558